VLEDGEGEHREERMPVEPDPRAPLEAAADEQDRAGNLSKRTRSPYA
jgi:hypothetical protein